MEEHRDGARNHRLDPTKMRNQPALQQSHGTIWIVMGGLFLVASLIPFGALIFAGSGRSTFTALAAAAILIVLYATLVTARFTVERRKPRLRIMAASMLTMAVASLLGIWLCALIENAPAQ